jgi:hypothetical protein
MSARRHNRAVLLRGLLLGAAVSICAYAGGSAQAQSPSDATGAPSLSANPLGRVAGDPPHQGPYPDIPCICLFQGRQFHLGDIVCMQTHLGTVLTRCELVLNNTSWMPSQQPCEISSVSRRPMTPAPRPVL